MKRALALLLTVSIAASLVACSSSSSSSTASSAASSATASSSTGDIVSAKDTLTVEIPSDPGDLSAYGVYNATANNIKDQIFDKLVFPNTDGGYDNRLIDKYEWTDDTHILITLRNDVYFTSGEKLTTEDVLYSFECCRDNASWKNQVKHIDFDNTKIIDDVQISIALTAPTSLFFSYEGNVPICSKKAMENNPDGEKTNPTGSGPYKVSSYVSGDSVTLTANEKYWGRTPYITTIKHSVITESSQRTIALETGSVDFLWDVPTTDVENLDADSQFVLYKASSAFTPNLICNCTTSSIMQYKELRQIVTMAIDAEAVTQVAYAPLGTTAFTYFTSIFKGVTGGAERYNDGPYCGADISKAKEMLAEFKAAHPEVTNYDVTILTNGQTAYADSLQVIKNELDQVGFNCTIASYESAVFMKMILEQDKGEWDLYMLRSGGASGMIADALNSQYGSNGSQSSKLDNAELEALCDEVVTITDEAKATEMIDKIMAILDDECPIIPITQQITAWAYVNGLEGVNLLGTAQVFYADWYFSK